MLQHARWARLADGADEIHQMRIAQRTIAAFKDTGSTSSATGGYPSDQVTTFAVSESGFGPFLGKRQGRLIVVDEDIYQRINTLVDEEKVLRENETPDDVTRLAHIEETLDQCWIYFVNAVRCVSSPTTR